jgi:hypothetical protein
MNSKQHGEHVFEPLINKSESEEFISSITNNITSQLLSMATTDVVLTIVDDKRLPSAPFDMLFFATVMERVCAQHERMKKLLNCPTKYD